MTPTQAKEAFEKRLLVRTTVGFGLAWRMSTVGFLKGPYHKDHQDRWIMEGCPIEWLYLNEFELAVKRKNDWEDLLELE